MKSAATADNEKCRKLLQSIHSIHTVILCIFIFNDFIIEILPVNENLLFWFNIHVTHTKAQSHKTDRYTHKHTHTMHKHTHVHTHAHTNMTLRYVELSICIYTL